MISSLVTRCLSSSLAKILIPMGVVADADLAQIMQKLERSWLEQNQAINLPSAAFNQAQIPIPMGVVADADLAQIMQKLEAAIGQHRGHNEGGGALGGCLESGW